MDKKIILFGAGHYGQMALSYYGAENVEYFADNNEKKIGTFIKEKRVIGFEQLKEIYVDFNIVISSTYKEQIIKQLKENGINQFICFNPALRNFFKIISENNVEKYNSIAIYGTKECSSQILSDFKALNMIDKIKYIVFSNKSDYQTNKISKCVVKDLNKIEDKIDCIVIGDDKYASALEAKLTYLKEKNIEIINIFKMRRYYDEDEILFTNQFNENLNKDEGEEEWNKFNKNNPMIESIKEYVNVVHNNVPLFQEVEIETINRCNGLCEFCPVNRKEDPRIEKHMSKELFQDIINQLEKIGYSGRISLFSNNEPLLDERIIEFSKFTREHLPKAKIHMFTNGTLFTLEKFKQLIEYLDELIIDNYRTEKKLIKPVEIIKDYCEQHEELLKKVTIVFRNPKEILTTRGGKAPNRSNMISYGECKCALPYQQLIIRPDGKLSLCCNDPLGYSTLGDLTQESILEAWYGEKYNKVRQALYEGRKNYSSCEFCDTFYLY